MSTRASKPIIYFYRKDGCELCDVMARGLIEFKRELDSEIEFEIIERDIEDDEEWYQHYWEYIPTLVIGTEEICHYFLDKEELKAALSGDS